MTNRYDVGQFKKTPQGKVYFVRLGSATPDQQKTGFTIYLDALPLPDGNGSVRFSLVPPREQGNRPVAQSRPAPQDDQFEDNPF